MKIPDSISAMVYSMRHPYLWTLMVWAIAVVGYLLMCMTSKDYVPVAFTYLACISFVGCMPLISGEHNTMHWAFGITGCAASQLWCLLVAMDNSWQVVEIWVTAWVLYGIIMLCAFFKHWCFWMEVWCMLATILVSSVSLLT